MDKIKCNKCDKEAEYVVDGQSVCKDHRGNDSAEPQQNKTQGEILSGM